MADANVLYHRCYWDFTRFAKPERRLPDPLIQQVDPRKPVSGSIQGVMLLARALRPVDLYPKPGQDFEKAATQWEQDCSVLSSDDVGIRFSPVVNSKEETGFGYPVIAHVAKLPGSHIAAPKETLPNRNIWDLNPLLSQGVPVFASNIPYPGGAWVSLDTPGWLSFHVLTDIQGAVLAQLSTTRSDYAESEDPLLDMIVTAVMADLAIRVGKGLITALVRRFAGKSIGVVENAAGALARARKAWGNAEVLDGGLAKASTSELGEVKQMMERLVPDLVDPAPKGQYILRTKSVRELDSALQRSGFRLTKVEVYPPGSKGYQLFYQKGNVVARFKTLGEAAGKPRAGVPHLSFSLMNGKGVDWTNELAKFSAAGKPAPKSVAAPPGEPRGFKPGKDFKGNDQRMVVIDSAYTDATGDAWANSVHFNATAAFKQDGVAEIVSRAPGGGPK